MEIVENTLPVEVDEFLSRPLFCHLGTVGDGDPRISPLWFLWEDESIWIIADTEGKTYPARVEEHPETVLSIEDLNPASGLVQHVGMRGTAELVPLDEGRVARLFERYLGDERADWDSRFCGLSGDRWQFIRFDPDTVVARDQSFSPSLD